MSFFGFGGAAKKQSTPSSTGSPSDSVDTSKLISPVYDTGRNVDGLCQAIAVFFDSIVAVFFVSIYDNVDKLTTDGCVFFIVDRYCIGTVEHIER